MSRATPSVFAIFLIGGTLISYLLLWTTERWLISVERPGEEVLPIGLFGALVLTGIWIFPAQAFVTILASIFFSFFKRVPLWFVLFIMIPICGLLVFCSDISDKGDPIQKSDYRKLLYWTFVIAPGELLCAKYVAMRTGNLSRGTRAAARDGS